MTITTADVLGALGDVLRASCGRTPGARRVTTCLQQPAHQRALRLLFRLGMFRIIEDTVANGVRGYWPEDDPDIEQPPRPAPVDPRSVPAPGNKRRRHD